MKNRKGLNLIELIVVIAAITVLTVLVLIFILVSPSVSKISEEYKIEAAKKAMEEYILSLEFFQEEDIFIVKVNVKYQKDTRKSYIFVIPNDSEHNLMISLDAYLDVIYEDASSAEKDIRYIQICDRVGMYDEPNDMRLE